MSVGEDRRVQYTKMFLREALIELMKEKPIGKVTPTELCRRADINRNTFYSHYSCAEDLLRSIEDELEQRVLQSFRNIDSGDTLALINGICAAIADNADICSVIFSSNGDSDFLLRLLGKAHDITIAEWKRKGIKLADDDLELVYSFCSNGSVAVIRDWIAEGMKKSPEELAAFIGMATGLGLKAFSNETGD